MTWWVAEKIGWELINEVLFDLPTIKLLLITGRLKVSCVINPNIVSSSAIIEDEKEEYKVKASLNLWPGNRVPLFS